MSVARSASRRSILKSAAFTARVAGLHRAIGAVLTLRKRKVVVGAHS
jgi:hypothetical protein